MSGLSRIKQKGLGLIEILITLLVLAIGLLGVAQLQLLNLSTTQSTNTRMKAVLLAHDLAERMRVNPAGALAGHYLRISSSSEDGAAPIQRDAPGSPACNGGCGSDELAERDVREWLENFIDVPEIGADGDNYIPALPNATADLRSSVNNRFTLEIRWQEIDRALSGPVTRSYEQEIEL